MAWRRDSPRLAMNSALCVLEFGVGIAWNTRNNRTPLTPSPCNLFPKLLLRHGSSKRNLRLGPWSKLHFNYQLYWVCGVRAKSSAAETRLNRVFANSAKNLVANIKAKTSVLLQLDAVPAKTIPVRILQFDQDSCFDSICCTTNLGQPKKTTIIPRDVTQSATQRDCSV